jgi:Ca2+-binding RTX toxin-like protein
MTLCNCWTCTPSEAPPWLICASVDTPVAGPSDIGLTANTAIVTSIGTSGNFVNQDINGILSSLAWSGTSATYSFPSSAALYPEDYFDPAVNNGFTPMNAAQQDVVRYAFGLISKYTLFNFTEITETLDNPAKIRIAGSASPATSRAYYPGNIPDTGGDIWFGNIRFDTPVQGGYAFFTILHEIGHAVGLKHGHETDSSPNNAAYGLLPANHNSTEWSIMTYASYVGAAPSSVYTNAAGSFAQTYMINDIAALQYMYGADFTTNAGNTTYTWSPLTGEMFIDGVGQGASSTNTAFASIWDGNGTDTYDLSNYTTSLSLDLRPGEWSTFDTNQLARLTASGSQLAHGNVANAHLYLNSDTRSLIENAIGGSGHDTIRGNQANNLLRGNAGNDTLHGEGGIDTAVFAGLAASYTLTWLGGTSFTVAGADGTDTITDIEFLQFDDETVAVPCFAAGTLIATPEGPRPVEALRIGDPVLTRRGPPRPVKWIGRRSYDTETVSANPQLRPVRIRAGALGPGQPRRDLVLSPQHAVFLPGPPSLLVPAACLVNFNSIIHEPAGAISYFHIETHRHDIILAEAAPVETFIDQNTRHLFDNAAEYAALYPGEAARPAPLPRTEQGFALETARRRIAARAGLPTPPPLQRPGPLIGHIERIRNGMLEGWAADPANPDHPVELLLRTPHGERRILANAWRADLQRAGIGTARHGFRIPAPALSARITRTTDGAALSWLG